eukprot:777167-Rhodomonas_salina.1
MKECAAAMAKDAARCSLLKTVKKEEQKGAPSMLEECAAAMAKEKAASAERAAAFDEFCARKRTQRMKEFLPKLAVQLGQQYGRGLGGEIATALLDQCT